MPLHAPLAATLRDAGIAVEHDAPLHRRVWWRVGGPADGYAELHTLAQLQAAQAAATAHGVPIFVLGNGSNLLVSDEGVRGLVVRLAGELADVQADDGLLRVGAGLRNTVLLARAAKHGWTGLGPLAGIPGTVGGAVKMNAGSTLGEVSDVLVAVDVVTPDGAHHTLSAGDLQLGYRSCTLPSGAIVAQATFRLTAEDPEAHEARLRAFLDRRKATQPLDQPSCGSTFRNPPGDAAGRLIEAAGLKGFAIGGAMISPKHANFIVNTGDATASDIRAVLEHARWTVREQFGVDLHPEVVVVGAFPEAPGRAGPTQPPAGASTNTSTR
jgi:UDP-N-acetylmuramate dehydrogenase